MALFRATITRASGTINGQRVEKGMSVEVVTNSIQTCEGKQEIAEAFKSKYGLDIQKIGYSFISSVNMNIQKI